MAHHRFRDTHVSHQATAHLGDNYNHFNINRAVFLTQNNSLLQETCSDNGRNPVSITGGGTENEDPGTKYNLPFDTHQPSDTDNESQSASAPSMLVRTAAAIVAVIDRCISLGTQAGDILASSDGPEIEEVHKTREDLRDVSDELFISSRNPRLGSNSYNTAGVLSQMYEYAQRMLLASEALPMDEETIEKWNTSKVPVQRKVDLLQLRSTTERFWKLRSRVVANTLASLRQLYKQELVDGSTLHIEIDSILVQLENLLHPELERLQAQKHDLLQPGANPLESMLRKTNNIVLDHLEFFGMKEREHVIPVAHEKTFSWADSASGSSEVRWDNLIAWLRKGQGCYWINGKAASGKSTLMKYLVNSERVRQACKDWAEANVRHVPTTHETNIPNSIWHSNRITPLAHHSHMQRGSASLIINRFFFWHLGTKIQKSSEGLLRSLLRELLSALPHLIEHTLPLFYYEALMYSLNKDAGELRPASLSVMEIKTALLKTIELLPHNVSICFFIDGVDEFAGSPEELCDLLKSLTNRRVKLVVASRPITACMAAFGTCPGLRLQDLTQNDISNYVQSVLYDSQKFQLIRERSPESAKSLIETILSKASGVFLWVMLVVRSLLRAIDQGDEIGEMVELVDQLPDELLPLYKHMMGIMRPSYQKQASRYLQIVLEASAVQQNGRHFSIEQLHYAEKADYHDAIAAVPALPRDHLLELEISRMEARLQSRCCGLLELRVLEARADSSVMFLHKTVVDFLHEPGVLSFLKNLTTINHSGMFCPSKPLAVSCLCLIKARPVESLPPSNWQESQFHDSLPEEQRWLRIREYVGFLLAYTRNVREQDSDFDEVERAALEVIEAYTRVKPEDSGLTQDSASRTSILQRWVQDPGERSVKNATTCW